ncbi:MAG: efflux RND transporter permease subunit, partial [Candidatus Kapaibacteriota bacterium]
DSGRTRLRPILMTTLAMILGMLPIALSKSSGAEWKTGLSWAIIGGLSSSLLLTLILVPVVYFIVESLKDKRRNTLQNQVNQMDIRIDEGIS